jgi:hypothetical protein
MPETTTTAPSQALRDLVANVTDEGLELLRRVTAFAADVRQAGRDFDAEAAELGHTAYQAAAVRAGLGVLHALAEQMADALAEANGDDALAADAAERAAA